MIYLDNAATTLCKPEAVGQAMIEALETAGNAGRGAHAPTMKASRLLYDTRRKLARLFGVSDPSRIAFTTNATEALNLAIRGLLGAEDHVITSICEHNSVLRPVYEWEERGGSFSLIPADEKGRICYEQIESLIRKNTKAIVITHASNVTGNVTDLKRVAETAEKYGLLLIVDASQSAGVISVDVEEIGIDVLCFTGHKGLMGPQGTGGIYVRPGLEIAPLKVGGSGIHSFDHHHPSQMPEALEAGTQNIPGIAGLHAAVTQLLDIGVETIGKKEQWLARRFLDQIRQIPDIHLYGDYEAELRTGVVSLNLGEEDSAYIADRLWEKYEICVRAGAHCAPLVHEHFGTVEQGIVRFSFSFYNTEAEVDQAAEALWDLWRELFRGIDDTETLKRTVQIR